MTPPVPRLAQHREAMTLRIVLTAARKAFAERGYAGASIRFIAQEAGVSPQTIYAHFESKAGLVMGLVDLMDEDAGLSGLFDSPAAEGSPAQILATLAQGCRQVHERCGDILGILASGTAVDPAIAAAQAEGTRRNRLGIETSMERIRATGTHPATRSEDVVAALMTTGVADSLTKDAGWTFDEYETWLGATIKHTVLDAQSSPEK